MYLWKLSGPNKLQRLEAPLPAPEEGKIRVRITKVLLNRVDSLICSGAVKAKYPLIPGRYAVGVVAGESGNPLFPKGTRVVLHSYRAADGDGTAKRDFREEDYSICGRTEDGFLSDFVMVSPDGMSALPASVNDERGLLLYQVAIARRIADKLGTQKGGHVAVVGANMLGILICQLLIYQQAAPILIDSDPKKLEFAKNCGIYYTMPSDDKLLENVASVTGGRLVHGAVFVGSAAGNAPETAFSMCAADSKVVICGNAVEKMQLDLEVAFRKHLTIFCVNHGAGYLKNAINLMANKAVDPTAFRAEVIRPNAVSELLLRYGSGLHADFAIHIVDLLQ